MTLERFILITIAILSLVSILYVPQNHFRKALLSMLAFQATTWFVSITLVNGGLVEFPVREFVRATAVLFTPQFLFYPAIFTWFIFLYPNNRNFVYKLLHWTIFISLSSWFAFFIGVYTDLSEFLKGTRLLQIFNTYWRFALQYLVSYLYIKWFFKKPIIQEDKNVLD